MEAGRGNCLEVDEVDELVSRKWQELWDPRGPQRGGDAAELRDWLIGCWLTLDQGTKFDGDLPLCSWPRSALARWQLGKWESGKVGRQVDGSVGR